VTSNSTNKTLSKDEILRLNGLLDDTLHQADKEQLIACVRLLGTSVASLKIKYQTDDEVMPQVLKQFVGELESDSISDELVDVMAKSIIECATAIAVAKKAAD